MEDGDRRDTVRNSVYNPDCSFYHMLQSHIYLSDESRHCRQGLNLKTTVVRFKPSSIELSDRKTILVVHINNLKRD